MQIYFEIYSLPSILVTCHDSRPRSNNKAAATAPHFIPYQVCPAIVASSKLPNPPVSKMTWSKVAESQSSTKWICIASTKEYLETVKDNTVLGMLPGTEVTLLSESQVDFNLFHFK